MDTKITRIYSIVLPNTIKFTNSLLSLISLLLRISIVAMHEKDFFYEKNTKFYLHISAPASNQIVSYNDFKSSSRLPRYSFPSKTYQKAYNQNLQVPKSSSHYTSFSKNKQDSRKMSRKKLFLMKSEKKHQSHAETVLSALENLWKKHFGVFTKFWKLNQCAFITS